MNYTAFKTHLTTFLWKTNDSVLVSSMDNLILMANSALSRSLRVSQLQSTTTLALTTVNEDSALPATFRKMIQVSKTNEPFVMITKYQMLAKRAANTSNLFLPYYSITGNEISFAGPFATTNETIDLEFMADVPDFATADASFLTDGYLDLYTYAVLKHTAPFLREDERVPLWQNFYTEALNEANEEDAFGVSFGGSPLGKALPTRSY